MCSNLVRYVRDKIAKYFNCKNWSVDNVTTVYITQTPVNIH